ncbi:hypothetical protein IJ541_04060 [bacterium]|nr:hypothetical protein [bacterium]
MSVKPIIPSIENNNAKKININNTQPQSVNVAYTPNMSIPKDTVSFQGGLAFNPIVATMDFIEAGGYAASFIIQDGLGFIVPRVGKGLFRGSEKTDENGNPVLDENGKQKRELNWQLARKEFLREIITGPSAFLIPLAMLSVIKKYAGAGNNVKLNYLNGFKEPFTKFAQENVNDIANGTNLSRNSFYKSVYENVVEQSINSKLPEAERLSAEKVTELAEKLTQRQLEVEEVLKEKQYQGFFNRKARAQKLQELGGSVEDMFMNMKKNIIGGTVNEMSVEISTSQGRKGGSISELGAALSDYFDDAIKSTRKALKDNLSAENVENVVKRFTNHRMGTRILSNLGIFGTVALFYTQIPKLYNMGLEGNPALKGTVADKNNQKSKVQPKNANNTQVQKDTTGKDVPFTGMASMIEKAGEKTFSHAKLKTVSDIFELNGPVMSGLAMPVLLYGFCIPPRLVQAEDKYDYGEIVLRDMTSFTALLFGAKALARLFSDGFTKITGLALNKKDMENRNVFQKIIDYLNPADTHHSVLSSKQLNNKYTNIDQYKGGVNGFIQFIEESGGNIKKAFTMDKDIKASVEEILKKYSSGKSYADATAGEIKEALKSANAAADKTLINKFYELFKTDNGLLRKAKTCNSTFGFVSTILLIPGLIIWLASACEKMTARKTKEDMEAEKQKEANRASSLNAAHSQTPSMAGFLGKSIR